MFKVPSSLIVSDKPEASSKDHDQDEIIDTPDTDDITEQATSQVPSKAAIKNRSISGPLASEKNNKKTKYC